VFVSSHLLAEMANTADRLVVIGRGKLIAATTMSEFLSKSGVDTVRVRSPQAAVLRGALAEAGMQVHGDGDGLLVRGGAIEQIGELAARHGVTLHELSPQRASLEEAYMQLTDAAVDYRASEVPS
jgi:ABC-2 type transport system ATP-binding protein